MLDVTILPELSDRIDEMAAIHKIAHDRLAELTLICAALTSSLEFDDAHWAGLATNKRDANGMQWPTSILNDKGVLLAGDDEDDDIADSLPAEFEYLDETTRHIWEPLTATPSSKPSLAEQDPTAERFLNLSAVLATWPAAMDITYARYALTSG